MPRILSLIVLLWLVAAPFPGARAGAGATVSFIPQWVPQAQFAGYYVAYEKGFYRARGLEVKILKGGPDFPPSELLPAGQADFGTMFLTTAIVKRAKGYKFINIGQIVQRSALMLVAKKSSGIKVPADIQNQRVGLWGAEFQIQPRAFFRQHRLKVKEIPQNATMNLFLRGGVALASAMWYNEYYQIILAGVNPDELTTFLLSDYGLKFPEDGIYCLESTYQQDPLRCLNFVRASLEGWHYAFKHPEEALDIVMKYANAAQVATNRVHQRWMLDRMRDLILPPGGGTPLGCLEKETYLQVARELKKNGLIHMIPDFSQFHIDCRCIDEK
jgi:NitT/TauT family transport system substrate-binding protein